MRANEDKIPDSSPEHISFTHRYWSRREQNSSALGRYPRTTHHAPTLRDEGLFLSLVMLLAGEAEGKGGLYIA